MDAEYAISKTPICTYENIQELQGLILHSNIYSHQLYIQYIYTLTPFVMLTNRCASYICNTVHDILYQAQVSHGHDYRMQMLFDGNFVPDHLLWSEMSLLFICNLFVL